MKNLRNALPSDKAAFGAGAVLELRHQLCHAGSQKVSIRGYLPGLKENELRRKIDRFRRGNQRGPVFRRKLIQEKIRSNVRLLINSDAGWSQFGSYWNKTA